MMKYPKLKNALLCRILSYAVVIGAFGLPIVLVFHLPFLPDTVKILTAFLLIVGLLIYLCKNFVVLMLLDMSLGMLQCHNQARTQYPLPGRRSVERIEACISRYGTQCTPTPLMPQPTQLRYRFSHPITVYTKGIEKVVASYHVDVLDANSYRAIFRSAEANSETLTGRKKALFLDSAQKKAPLNRVTVIVIFARKVALPGNLYELVCKQCGDDFEESIVPCVIDLEKQSCVFNSLRMPTGGYAYPVKNRGIRLVKRLVFGGQIRLKGNSHFLPPTKDLSPEQSLWDFWKDLHYEIILREKETTRRFEALSNREIRLEEDLLYLKWDDHGICLLTELDGEQKIARIETIAKWSYPKAHPIGKKTIPELQNAVTDYFSKQGYTVEFFDTTV